MSIAFKYDIARPLTDQVREAAARGEVVLPPMPEVGRRLMALLEQEEIVNVHQVAETVGDDPAIAAAVLRMANSAYFGGLQPVSDLNQAIGRLGTRRVGSLAAMLFHKGHYAARKASRRSLLEALWCHAVATAIAARHLASLGGAGVNLEEAYLAGLLHDIGKLLAVEAIDHLSESGGEIAVSPEIETEVMDRVHTGLGHLVLTQWRFPEAICRVALDHHADPAQLDDPLVLRVQAADAVAKRIVADPVIETALSIEDVPALEKLGVSETRFAGLLIDAADELTRVQNLF